MMAQFRFAPLVAALAGTVLLTAGCSDRNSTETVGQKMDRTADRVATATDKATTQAAAAVDDSALTAKVKAAIIAEPGLSALQINVDTKNSVVTLSGTVNDAMAKDHAMEVSQKVSGVRSVVDNLVVKPTQSG